MIGWSKRQSGLRVLVTAAASALASAALSAGAGAATPAPSVTILSPAAGTATNAQTLEVHVRFRASATASGPGAGPTGNVRQLVLSLDGADVARYENSPSVKEGTHVFTLALARVDEGEHVLRARGYQGSPQAGLVGWSDPVTVVVDRTPPELVLTAPSDGVFVRQPRVRLEGTASDALSGLASLVCAGASIPVAPSFSCEAALAEGANELVVRATDRAGNVRARGVTVDHFPGGLAGEPQAAALPAVRDVFTDGAYAAPGEIADGVVRTQLELAFAKDAGIGAVNALLRRIGAEIVSQREGVLIAVVRIPDPGSLAALEQLRAGLAGDPALRFANEVTLPEPEELPNTVDTSPGRLGYVRHQLAVRAHAAWNARNVLFGAGPTLVVGDFFGAGPPGDLFDVIETPADFAAGAPDVHGYHVLGIATGTFNGIGGSAAADAVTGIFAGPIRLAVADVQAGLGSQALDDRMLELIENAPGNAVLNTSLGSRCGTPALRAANCTVAKATEKALLWIERVRGTNPANPATNLEGKFFHATSAGNIEDAVGPIGADVNSSWSAAALLTLVDPASGVVVPNLTNTLVVENFSATASQPFRPNCLAASSEVGGTIGGIGESVHSFASPTTTATLSGTSMATPQVAGVAAFVWELNPGLSPAQLAALLRRTGQAVPGCGLVIDAYAAVLAADEANSSQRARRAVLDTADDGGQAGSNGAFDERDVDLALGRLELGSGDIDYGRFDLNGDGRTGGDQRAGFDLDLSGVAQGVVTQAIEGGTVEFDEAALTDIEILCYYAYSGLYTPVQPQRREELLGLDRCLPVDIDVTFPSTISPGANAVLSVSATRRDFSVGQRGVVVELTPTGGTVNSFGGVTGADGIFQTSARLSAGSFQITIEVVARAGVGGPVLARTTVQASAGLPPPPPPPVNSLYRGTAARYFQGNLQGQASAGRYQLFVTRNGDVVTVWYIRCLRAVTGTRYLCTLMATYEATAVDGSFAASGRRPGSTTPFGSMTASFGGNTVTGTVVGEFVQTPSGEVCGLDLAPTFYGPCKHDFVADLVPGPLAGILGGDLRDPWPYAPEAHGQIDGFHDPDHPDEDDAFFFDIRIGGLVCEVPWYWRPAYISQFSIGDEVYLYCEAPALSQFAKYPSATHLFRAVVG